MHILTLFEFSAWLWGPSLHESRCTSQWGRSPEHELAAEGHTAWSQKSWRRWAESRLGRGTPTRGGAPPHETHGNPEIAEGDEIGNGWEIFQKETIEVGKECEKKVITWSKVYIYNRFNNSRGELPGPSRPWATRRSLRMFHKVILSSKDPTGTTIKTVCFNCCPECLWLSHPSEWRYSIHQWHLTAIHEI